MSLLYPSNSYFLFKKVVVKSVKIHLACLKVHPVRISATTTQTNYYQINNPTGDTFTTCQINCISYVKQTITNCTIVKKSLYPVV